MQNHRIPSRPHLQGIPAPLRLCHSAHKLTDGAGLVLLRRLWNRWNLGSWMDDLKLVAARGCAGSSGRRRCPTRRLRPLAPAGSACRRPAAGLARLAACTIPLDQGGVVEQVILVLDSTICVRYGELQAGAAECSHPLAL